MTEESTTNQNNPPTSSSDSPQWDWKYELGMLNKPFLDDNLMDSGPISCSLADFKNPRLRKCSFDLDSIEFSGPINADEFQRLHGGADGYSWKIRSKQDGTTLVLKMFWDSEPRGPIYYFAAQRESQNAALLQMMEAAVSEPEKGPILLHPNPPNVPEVLANLYTFSDEIRQKIKHLDCDTNGYLHITQVPRLRKCYGWLQLTTEDLRRHLPDGHHMPWYHDGEIERHFEPETKYTALVYEYIEEGVNNPEAVKLVLKFLWRAGFARGASSQKADNWTNSVLLDLSDIIQPRGFGWSFCNYELDETTTTGYMLEALCPSNSG